MFHNDKIWFKITQEKILKKWEVLSHRNYPDKCGAFQSITRVFLYVYDFWYIKWSKLYFKTTFPTCDNDKDSVQTRQNVHLNSKILKFSRDFVCSISKEIVRSTQKVWLIAISTRSVTLVRLLSISVSHKNKTDFRIVLKIDSNDPKDSKMNSKTTSKNTSKMTLKRNS